MWFTLFGEFTTYYIVWGIRVFVPVPNMKRLILKHSKNLKNFPERLDEVQSKRPDKKIEAWFQDEARFGQQGTTARIWALCGSRPRALRQTKYEWLYVIGAVYPHTGQSIDLLSPYMNAKIMDIYLQQFSREFAPDVHAVLIWVQAGYHKSKELKIPQNVTIIPLTPYSPELNPMENLWHYFRSHYWATLLMLIMTICVKMQ